MDYSFYDHYIEALAIIENSLKRGRPLFQFKRWDKLDYSAKMKALEDSKCAGCHRVKLLIGTIQNIYSTEKACMDCADENNTRLMQMREEFNNI
jgi:hypothetical protein